MTLEETKCIHISVNIYFDTFLTEVWASLSTIEKCLFLVFTTLLSKLIKGNFCLKNTESERHALVEEKLLIGTCYRAVHCIYKRMTRGLSLRL